MGVINFQIDCGFSPKFTSKLGLCWFFSFFAPKREITHNYNDLGMKRAIDTEKRREITSESKEEKEK